MKNNIDCTILFDIKRGTLIRTEEHIAFEINGVGYIIPRGFISDGMSVPRLLWRLLSPPIYGETLIPSIIHDWMYTELWPRRKADLYYYHSLLDNGYPKWKAILTYIGVRLFGASHYGRN